MQFFTVVSFFIFKRACLIIMEGKDFCNNLKSNLLNNLDMEKGLEVGNCKLIAQNMIIHNK